MPKQDAYIALMCSLPGSERLFVARQPPLSRIRLDRRLTALSPEDSKVLKILEHALSWNAYDMDVTDAQAIQRCKQAMLDIPQPTLRKLFTERMELRSVVAALRLRKRGEPAPSDPFGVGRWSRHISRQLG